MKGTLSIVTIAIPNVEGGMHLTPSALASFARLARLSRMSMMEILTLMARDPEVTDDNWRDIMPICENVDLAFDSFADPSEGNDRADSIPLAAIVLGAMNQPAN